jgi:protein TonB
MIHLSQTNTNDFDALVFDHRNQAYGAYVLRREYPRQVLKSLLIGIAIFASILAIPYLKDLFTKEKVSTYTPPVETTVDLTEIKEDKIIPPEVMRRKQEPAGPTQRWTVPLIVDFTQDSMPTAKDLELVNPAAFTGKGEPGGWGIPCEGCVDDVGEIVDVSIPIYPYATLEEKPEFKGGDAAMWQFLGDNLVYPSHAKEIGIEGKVYISFVIDEFGNVTNAKIAREVGGGLEEEALRVVKMMPRWKPGRQAGHPVRVSYSLPIVFNLN